MRGHIKKEVKLNERTSEMRGHIKQENLSYSLFSSFSVRRGNGSGS